MFDFLKQLTDPQSIISFGGLTALLFLVFAETGLLIGFFLPGDSLIFISGLACVSDPHLLDVNLTTLILLLTGSAILGNCIGYWFGSKVGPALFNRPDSLIFKKRYLEITKSFYDKNGGKTLIFGRFLPIIRTFAPILAGIVKIDFKQFMLYNVIGAITWILPLCCLGYYLGTYLWVQQNIGFIVVALILITLIPLIIGYLRTKNR